MDTSKIIKDIDRQINMLMLLRKSFEDLLLAGGIIPNTKISQAVNILQNMEKDLARILDDVCRLKGGSGE